MKASELAPLLSQNKSAACLLVRPAQADDRALLLPLVQALMVSKDPANAKQINARLEEQSLIGEGEDSLWIFPEKNRISVDSINQILDFSYLKSWSGSYRFVCLSSADCLERSSGNKLLKILEEPPEGLFFLFTSFSPKAVIPTLTSRLQVFNLDQSLDFPAIFTEVLGALSDSVYPSDKAVAWLEKGENWNLFPTFVLQKTKNITSLSELSLKYHALLQQSHMSFKPVLRAYFLELHCSLQSFKGL